MKENLLLLKDSLEPWKIKRISIWLQYEKNVYIDQLDHIDNKYRNTYHSTIQMKPVDVKLNTYIDSGKETNEKDPNLKIGDNFRRSDYKNVFVKGYFSNWSEEGFVIKKVKNTVPY